VTLHRRASRFFFPYRPPCPPPVFPFSRRNSSAQPAVFPSAHRHGGGQCSSCERYRKVEGEAFRLARSSFAVRNDRRSFRTRTDKKSCGDSGRSDSLRFMWCSVRHGQAMACITAHPLGCPVILRRLPGALPRWTPARGGASPSPLTPPEKHERSRSHVEQ
jgi:hypothetical protein